MSEYPKQEVKRKLDLPVWLMEDGYTRMVRELQAHHWTVVKRANEAKASKSHGDGH